MNVETVVKTLKTLTLGNDKSHYKLAEAFTNACDNVIWSDTKYKTFNGMVNTILTIDSSKVFELISGYRSIELFNFKSKEIDNCLSELGWKRLTLVAQFESNKNITESAFIKKYRGMPLYVLKPKQEADTQGDRAYGFSVPKDVADKLDGILMQFGMTTQQSRRRGVREAVIQWLGTL